MDRGAQRAGVGTIRRTVLRQKRQQLGLNAPLQLFGAGEEGGRKVAEQAMVTTIEKCFVAIGSRAILATSIFEVLI